MPGLLSNPLKEEITQSCKKNHDSGIVNEEEKAPFGVVKKGKGKLQKHIGRNLPLEECIDPVEGDSYKEAKDEGLFLLWENRAEMGSGMEAHQDKTPVCQRQMEGTGDRRNSISRQEGLQVLAQKNPTQRLANHKQ